MKVHHNTIKKAKTHGITLIVEEGEVVATKGERRITAGLQGNKVLEDAIHILTAEHPVIQKIAKVAKERTATKVKTPKEADPYQDAAKLEGWSKRRGGGFKQEGVDAEDGGASDATTWRELCEEQDIEVESGEGNGRSIIKQKYKQKYRPTKMTCGDDMARKISEHVQYHNEDEGKDMIDTDKLKRFAEANGCWVASYRSLNAGMQRMNVANRLRGLLRKDPKYKIVWAD